MSEEKKGNDFPCSNCGATLVFKPGSNSLECPYCGTENNIEIDKEQMTEAVKELDYKEYLQKVESEENLEEIITIKCTSCGATFNFDENVTSGECAYCGRKIVAQQHTCKYIKPKALLPFKINKTEAAKSFKKWLKKLKFAPGKLKKLANYDKLNGVYMPYWTFDTDTETEYNGEKGEYYFENETYTTTKNNETIKKTRKVKKTKWQRVKGTIKKIFNDILTIASKSLQNKYIDKLEPWDIDNLIPYDDKFLTGFKVESYSIKLQEGFKKVKERIDNAIKTAIRKDIGGDEQKILAVKTNYNKISFKHILLPLWISAFRFNNKTYQFIINARTGEVHGDRPFSWIKITFTILTVLAVIALIIFLIVKFAN